MRPLKRPMFKTGGPIKEGVMNGLKDGGVATYMADATMMAGGGMPNMRGRVTGPGGYAGKTSMMDKAKTYGKGAAATIGSSYGIDFLYDLYQAGLLPFKDGGRIGYSNAGIVDPAVTGTFGDVVKKQFKKNPFKVVAGGGKKKIATGIMSNIYDKGKNLFNIQTLGSLRRQFPKAPVGLRGGFEKVPFMERAGAFLRLNPKTSIGAAYFSPEIIGAGKGLVENVALPIAKVIADPGGSRKKLYGKIKKKLGFEEEKTPPPGGDGTGRNLEIQQKGGTGPTQAEIDAKKKLNEEQRLNKIYKLLGVDRAKRNAASKALIDMSRYIDEGGRDVISKENIGSTISKAIGAFDKRLDKVDQLKEAAGLMQAKGIIEKDIRSSDNELKELQKEKIRKDIQKNFSDLKLVSKIPGQKGVNIAAASSSDNYRGNLITQSDLSETIEKVKKNEGILDETVIIENITNETIKDKNIADGDYTVGDALVTIEKGKVTAVLR